MAISVPEQPRWRGGGSGAEKLLWRWAVEQLPDPVQVLPEVALTTYARGRAEEFEADLVIVDPDGGVTVVEVKGGTVTYDAAQARWYRTTADGAEPLRDPVGQAKRARSLLARALGQHGFDPETIALRWAVAFPNCRIDAPGLPILDERNLWDAKARDQLALMYARTVGQLEGGEQPLGTERAGAIARLLRGRSVTGRPALSSAIDTHEEQVRILTESHRNVLYHFAHHRHVLVTGAAGTGKTVLAVHAAAQAAATGQRVLLACWNVVLARHLRDWLAAELRRMGSPLADEVTDQPTGRVVVSHLVGLARHAVRDWPADPDEAFYHQRLPDRLTPAVTGGEFDLVVLDEAQDLTERWVLAVAMLVARNGRWYAFADRQQDLFRADPALPEFLEVQHELRENFRNTPAIAAFASWFGEVEADCLADGGPPVAYVPVPHDAVVDATMREARRLRKQGVRDAELAVLWLFHNPWRGRTDELAERTLAGELVATNSASFKGMERPAVVLGLDMDPARADRREEVARAIYTAATRARSHLTVVGDPEVAEVYGFTELAGALRAAANGAATDPQPAPPPPVACDATRP